MVYFISDNTGLVKIGYTRHDDVRQRLKSLQTSNGRRLHVLGTFRLAGPASEAALHERFKSDRTRGEWFTLTPELKSIIDVAVADPAASAISAIAELDNPFKRRSYPPEPKPTPVATLQRRHAVLSAAVRPVLRASLNDPRLVTRMLRWKWLKTQKTPVNGGHVTYVTLTPLGVRRLGEIEAQLSAIIPE